VLFSTKVNVLNSKFLSFTSRMRQLLNCHKYYVFVHYPLSYLYLKTVLFIFQNTAFRGLDSLVR
jgi:hypothetical protein